MVWTFTVGTGTIKKTTVHKVKGDVQSQNKSNGVVNAGICINNDFLRLTRADRRDVERRNPGKEMRWMDTDHGGCRYQ